jgi:hypothetical protein
MMFSGFDIPFDPWPPQNESEEEKKDGGSPKDEKWIYLFLAILCLITVIAVATSWYPKS